MFFVVAVIWQSIALQLLVNKMFSNMQICALCLVLVLRKGKNSFDNKSDTIVSEEILMKKLPSFGTGKVSRE